MKHGYDPVNGFLCTWNGDFQFSKVDSIPCDTKDVVIVTAERRMLYEMVGCCFLSGFRDNSYVFRMGGFGQDMAIMYWPSDLTIRLSDGGSWTNIKKWCPLGSRIALCGSIVKSPDAMAQFCQMFPCESVYVCPLVDELAAFGALVSILDKEKPRRANLLIPNTENIDTEFREFDPKLAGDGLGRMAGLIHRGIPVLNEMRKSLGVSVFYGRIIHDGLKGGSEYIVDLDSINTYFPLEPVSAKLYAATSVPVRMVVTSEFRKASGCEREYADIFVASDYVPDLPVFMRFYKLMSGRDFVGTSNVNDKMFVRRIMPVFRYNRAYKLFLENAGKT